MPEARRILAQPGEPDRLPRSLVRGTFSLIQRFPTPEREELLLDVLRKDKVYAQYAALDALAAVGSRRALSVLAETRERVLRQYGPVVKDIAEFDQTAAAIRKRLGMEGDAADQGAALTAGGGVQAESSQNKDAGEPQKATSLASGERWGLVAVLLTALAIVAGVWWRLKAGGRTRPSP